MKKILMGAAAALAIAAPGLAHADNATIIGLGYSSTDFGGGDDIQNYGLNAGFNHEMNNGWVMQVDGEWGRQDINGCCYASSYGAVHLGTRTDTHEVAGFAGLTEFAGVSGLGVGLEGEMFLGNFNLGASAGYADFDDADITFSSIEVNGAYFFTPNLALTGLVAENNFDAGIGNSDYLTLGVGGEYRFENSPASIQLGYRNADFDGGDADIWSIGFKWDMGSNSVEDRTRNGVSYDGASNFFHNFNFFPAL
jgi:hypothetical protein